MSVVDGKNTLSLCDIYHIATVLRQEFERLISFYGPERLSLLVPPVVRSLEWLEYLMDAQHTDDYELQELRNYVKLLQAEKRSSAALKEKYEKELEVCERQWTDEAVQLADSRRKLQKQNADLRSLLSEDSISADTEAGRSRSIVELKKNIESLRETMQTQRTQLRTLQHDLSDKYCTLTAMEQVADHLMSLNNDLWQQNTQNQKHVEQDLDEVVRLQVMLKGRDEQLSRLKTYEQYILYTTTTDEQQQQHKELASLSSKNGGQGNTIEDETKDENRGVECMRSEEFDAVLQHRSQLTLQLHVSTNEYSGDTCQSNNSSPPVEGPINREPDEKLYPYLRHRRSRPSFIRQMFQQLFQQRTDTPAD